MPRHHLTVARPAADVFSIVTDPATQPRWQPSIVAIEPLDAGPLGLGSRVREVRSFLGHRVEAIWEVAAFDAGRHAAIRVVDGPVRGRASYDLTEVADGTRLCLEVDLEPRGAARLAAAALRPAAEAELAASCRRLRRLLEAPSARCAAAPVLASV